MFWLLTFKEKKSPKAGKSKWGGWLELELDSFEIFL